MSAGRGQGRVTILTPPYLTGALAESEKVKFSAFDALVANDLDSLRDIFQAFPSRMTGTGAISWPDMRATTPLSSTATLPPWAWMCIRRGRLIQGA